MSLKIKQSSAKKSNGRVADGTYLARIVQIIDMGEQLQTDYATGEAKTWDDGKPMYKPEIMVTFEFPSERIEIDGESRPRWQSKNYVASLHEKSALFGLIKAADPKANPKAYDVAKLIGKPVMVTVGSTSSGNAKISNVVGVPAGIPVPALENDPKVFDMNEPDMEVWDNMLKWVKDKIMESPSFRGSKLEELELSPEHESRPVSKKKPKLEEEQEDSFEDEIPF